MNETEIVWSGGWRETEDSEISEVFDITDIIAERRKTILKEAVLLVVYSTTDDQRDKALALVHETVESGMTEEDIESALEAAENEVERAYNK
jgi:hypothetical protein